MPLHPSMRLAVVASLALISGCAKDSGSAPAGDPMVDRIVQAVAERREVFVKVKLEVRPGAGKEERRTRVSGVDFDENELSLWLNGVALYRDGAPLDFDAAAVSAGLRLGREVLIRLTLKRGAGSIWFWTCDLTADYVRLNADYTT